MGKKAQARRESNARPSITGPSLRTAPNWPLVALSVAGMLLTGYLAWTALGGEPVKGCGIGSACDIVLNSQWSKFLGLPTALWGFLAYAALAATAFVKRVDRHWQYAWPIALFGILYSGYLTVVSLTILEAACPYCLTSLALMTAIFGLLTWQRPAEALEDFSWPAWLAKTAVAPAVIILLMHMSYSGVGISEDPTAKALADHLTKSGAKFYGAYWCPHCMEQKAYFAAAARRLPYIECSPNGREGPAAQVCIDAGVTSYPTWFINGKKYEEVVPFQKLSELSGFTAPAAPAP
jgi:uncharacterized membrane protein/glutaredoxin